MQKLSLSKSVQNIGYSVIREMAALAAGKEDVISLGIGEPDFDTPSPIITQAFADAQNGSTHYTPSQGDAELLAKLAVVESNALGIDIPSSSILITHGGMGALTAALRTCLRQGEGVLVVEPHFPDYLAHIAFAGGVPIKAVSRIEHGFIPHPEEIERAITENTAIKTKVLILNSPNNPTGAVIPKNVLDGIAEIAIRHNLIVISDEVYDQILFEPPFNTIYSSKGMTERTLVIKSFSKNYAMTGWRIGYCYGPQFLMEQMLKVVNYTTACASSIGQRAAVAALEIDQCVVAEMTKRFAARVDLVYDRLCEMDGIKVVKPHGSFYIFANIADITQDSREFAVQLLEKEKVVVVPGYAFGESAEGYIRIACTQSRELLTEAMERIEAFIRYKKGV